MTKITKTIAKKVLAMVDAGLCSGVGAPIPGKMCIEAAVCFAMGEPHGDEPSCVSKALRAFKIRLNDSRWSSNEKRAKGMRRLALIQLGSSEIADIELVGQLAAKAADWAADAARAAAYAAGASYAADVDWAA